MVNALHIGESPLAPQGSGRQKRPSYAILHGTQRYEPNNTTRPTRNSAEYGGLARNRTGVQGFAVLCVTTPPRGPVSVNAGQIQTLGAPGQSV